MRIAVATPLGGVERSLGPWLQSSKHYVNIDISFFWMSKCARQSADDFKTKIFPQTNRRLVSRNNEIELHRTKTELACLTQAMLGHCTTDPLTARQLGFRAMQFNFVISTNE